MRGAGALLRSNLLSSLKKKSGVVVKCGKSWEFLHQEAHACPYEQGKLNEWEPKAFVGKHFYFPVKNQKHDTVVSLALDEN